MESFSGIPLWMILHQFFQFTFYHLLGYPKPINEIRQHSALFKIHQHIDRQWNWGFYPAVNSLNPQKIRVLYQGRRNLQTGSFCLIGQSAVLLYFRQSQRNHLLHHFSWQPDDSLFFFFDSTVNPGKYSGNHPNWVTCYPKG